MATFLTFTFSALTYKFIEIRINFSKRDRVTYWLKFFLIGQAIAISLFFAGYQGVSKGWGQDWALNSHAIMQKGCDAGLIDLEKCSWGNPSSKEKMFITGDSMSWAIGDAFIASALERNMRAISLTKNGCSIAQSDVDRSSECGVWRERAINVLLREKPKLIVIANATGYPIEAVKGMGMLVSTLRNLSIKVIFVTPPPGGDAYSELRALSFRPGAKSREGEIQKKIDLSIYGLSELNKDSGLIIYDPAEDLCTSKCIIAKDGNEYYNYGEHLSLFANRVLEGSISKKVEKILVN
jgi:hypothetical protein